MVRYNHSMSTLPCPRMESSVTRQYDSHSRFLSKILIFCQIQEAFIRNNLTRHIKCRMSRRMTSSTICGLLVKRF